jgi:2-alkyl-3-oxoalkanoate reductase
VRVVVTGATGFLGSRLCLQLKSGGYDVIGIGRSLEKAKFVSDAGVELIKCDLTDLEHVKSVIPTGASIIHSAALSSSWGRYENFYKSNVTCTENIVSACLASSAARLVHISSPSIYCNDQHQLNIKETVSLPHAQISQYAATKLLAEKVVQSVGNKIPTVILRPQAIFGVGDLKIFPRLIDANNRTGVPFIDGGKALIDITHISNVVEATILAVQKDNVAGKIYNITNGEPMPFGNIAELLFSKMNVELKKKSLSFRKAMIIAQVLEGTAKLLKIKKEPLLTKYSACVLGRSRTLSIEAARNDLGYKPLISVEQGLDELASDYKTNEER